MTEELPSATKRSANAWSAIGVLALVAALITGFVAGDQAEPFSWPAAFITGWLGLVFVAICIGVASILEALDRR